jgi:hypothetical protein
MDTRVLVRRYDSVQQDWRAFLPENKSSFFHTHARELENAYLMLSISLNEALDLRQHGHGLKACQAAEVAPGLCGLLTRRLGSVLHSMRRQTRHFGIAPNLAPLEASNFRTERGQRAARFSGMVSRVLLSERSQFIHKVSTLEQIVKEIGDWFVDATLQLEPADSAHSAACWRILDSCHFDLNTCLRETLVLFKSFLVVLPDEQVDSLDLTIRGLCRTQPAHHFAVPVIHARRNGLVAGK